MNEFKMQKMNEFKMQNFARGCTYQERLLFSKATCN